MPNVCKDNKVLISKRNNENTVCSCSFVYRLGSLFMYFKITLFTLSAEMHVDFAVHVFSSLKEFAILMITKFKYNCPNDGS